MQMLRSLAFFENNDSVCLDWLITAMDDHLSLISRSATASSGDVVCQYEISLNGRFSTESNCTAAG